MFGVKDSLVVELGSVDADQIQEYDVAEGTKLMTYEFVLVPYQEAKELREKNAAEAIRKIGKNMKLWEGLPVPDVD